MGLKSSGRKVKRGKLKEESQKERCKVNMLKYTDYDVVFQEVPDEVTLAINLSNCPHRCPGCHSPQLQDNIGKELDEAALSRLIKVYENAITCICFMGGDASADEVMALAAYVRENWNGAIKTAWYSGNQSLNEKGLPLFDFIKVGPYVESLGGLNRETSNQRLYRIINGQPTDITFKMRDKSGK